MGVSVPSLHRESTDSLIPSSRFAALMHCKNKGVMVTPILGVKWLCENDTTFGVSNGVSGRLVS